MEIQLHALLFAPVLEPTDCHACGRPVEPDTWAVQIPGMTGAMCGACAHPLVEVALRAPMTLHDPLVERVVDELRLHDLIDHETPDIGVWEAPAGQRGWGWLGEEPDIPCDLVGRIKRVGDVIELTRIIQFLSLIHI